MAARAQTPALTLGNHIYLYRLLRDTLGAGKQTFLPAVEDALAAERLGAEDLGFASTRELLEALDDFISLKIFKGNRIYATVVAQPAWDEALAAGDVDKGSAKAGGKSWKRKKADKTLRAVKPRRVKRPEPEPEALPAGDAAESTPGAEPGIAPEADTPITSEVDAAGAPETVATIPEPAVEVAAKTGATTAPEEAATPAQESDLVADAADEPAPKPEPELAEEPAPEPQEEAEPAPAPAPEPEPSISFTILYDPTEDNEPEEDLSPEPETPSVDESETPAAAAEHEAPADTTAPAATPVLAPPSPAAPEPATPAAAAAAESETPSATPAAATAGEPATPAAPTPTADYPLDFTREVYCPGDLLLALTHLLPYGADVLGILSAYFDIARLAGTLEGTRSRATFPVAYIRESERREVLVTIKRRGGRAASGEGATWSIASVEHDD